MLRNCPVGHFAWSNFCSQSLLEVNSAFDLGLKYGTYLVGPLGGADLCTEKECFSNIFLQHS